MPSLACSNTPFARRHHETLNAPANLQSLYFTFQFYHFPPTTTDVAFLVQVCSRRRS